MPQQSKSVFYGAGNVGEAVVYDREAPNLFELIDKKKEDEKAQKLAEVKQSEKAQKDLEIKFKEAWYPAQSQIMSAYKKFSEEYTNLVRDGRQNDPETQILIQTKKAELDQMADKSKQFETAVSDYEKNSAELKKLGLKTDKVMTSFLENIKDENGNYKPIQEWNLGVLDLYQDDADNWDGTTVAKNFIEKIGEEIKQTASPTGTGYIRTIEQKYPTYVKTKPNGDIIIEKDGTPAIDVNSDIISKIKADKGATVVIDRMFELGKAQYGDNYKYEDAVKAFLRPHTKVSKKESLSNDQLYLKKLSYSMGLDEEVKNGNNFWQQMSNMLQGIREIKPDGEFIEFNGRRLQPIVSPMDGKMAKKTNSDGKEINYEYTTYYDPTTNKYFIKKSDDESISELTPESASKIVEAFDERGIPQALVEKEFNWINKDGIFTPKPISEQGKATVKKVAEESEKVQQTLTQIESELNTSKNSVVKSLEDLKTDDTFWKFGEFTDNDKAIINDKLNTLNTKNASIIVTDDEATKIPVKNPKIQLIDGEDLVVIDPITKKEYTVATDVTKENISNKVKELNLVIPKDIVEQSKKTTSTTTEEDLRTKYNY